MLDSISFCIAAHSGSEKDLEECLDRIQEQNIPNFEILVHGKGEDRPPVRFLENGYAPSESLNHIRNYLISQTAYPHIALIESSAHLSPEWFSDIQQDMFAEILGTRLTDQKGQRIVDWSYSFEMGNRVLVLPLDYDEWTPRAFVSGEVILFQKKVWDNIKFDEARSANAGLIHFCQQASELGYRLGISRAHAKVHERSESVADDSVVSNYQKSRSIYAEFREHLDAGNRLFDQGKFNEAQQAFEKVVSMHPSEPNLLAKLGWAFQNQGIFDRSSSQFEKALKTDPENSRALSGLGWAHFQQGQYDQAQPHFEKAVTLIPSYQTGPWMEAARGLAWAFYHQQQFEPAIRIFKEIEEEVSKANMDPPPDLYQGLGWSHFQTGKNQDAFNYFKKGLEHLDSGQKDLVNNLRDGMQKAAEAGNIPMESPGFFSKIFNK